MRYAELLEDFYDPEDEDDLYAINRAKFPEPFASIIEELECRPGWAYGWDFRTKRLVIYLTTGMGRHEAAATHARIAVFFSNPREPQIEVVLRSPVAVRATREPPVLSMDKFNRGNVQNLLPRVEQLEDLLSRWTELVRHLSGPDWGVTAIDGIYYLRVDTLDEFGEHGSKLRVTLGSKITVQYYRQPMRDYFKGRYKPTQTKQFTDPNEALRYIETMEEACRSQKQPDPWLG